LAEPLEGQTKERIPSLALFLWLLNIILGRLLMRNKKFVDDQRPDIRPKEEQEYIMPTLIPNNFLSHSSGSPEISQSNDIETMIAGLDEKWRNLKSSSEAKIIPGLSRLRRLRIF
jgi:hypothetical protein